MEKFDNLIAGVLRADWNATIGEIFADFIQFQRFHANRSKREVFCDVWIAIRLSRKNNIVCHGSSDTFLTGPLINANGENRFDGHSEALTCSVLARVQHA